MPFLQEIIANRMLARLKRTLGSFAKHDSPALRWLGALYVALRALKNRLFNRLQSARRRLLREDPAALQQVATTTWSDRYPMIFAACRDLTRETARQERAALRILSYGCSTGEEVFSLRKYFPEANIVGVDINEECIRVASKKNDDPRNQFLRHTDAWDEHTYDLVFCMAVLQRHSAKSRSAQNVREFYTFERFDEQLSKLDPIITRGGLLVIYHTFYRFRDAEVAVRYNAVGVPIKDSVPKFDRSGQRLEIQDYNEVIFKKTT